MSTLGFPWRILTAVAAVLGLAVALHVVPQALRALIDPAWTMLLLMIADALVVAWLARSLRSLGSVALLAAIFAFTVMQGQQAFAALPSIGLNLLLAAVLGVSLRRGSAPILTRVAKLSYPQDLTPAHERYLRGLTVVWTLFFLALAATSLALSLYAPFATWSFVINVCSLPMMLALFIGEWAARHRRAAARIPSIRNLHAHRAAGWPRHRPGWSEHRVSSATRPACPARGPAQVPG
jgi:uncharacterized membrane protein